MASRDHEVFKTLFERATANNLLLAMSVDALKVTRLSDPEAAAYLGVGHSTLAHKRSEQGALPEDQRDPRSVGSIGYIPNIPVEYRLYDLLQFKLAENPVSGVVKPRSEQARQKAAATVKTNTAKRLKIEQQRSAAAQSAVHRGFNAFMQTATGAETWPFSIQADGRPLDLYSAILDGKLTGNAERLNLQGFADRLARAASLAHSDQETDAIGSVTRVPKKSSRDSASRPLAGSAAKTL